MWADIEELATMQFSRDNKQLCNSRCFNFCWQTHKYGKENKNCFRSLHQRWPVDKVEKIRLHCSCNQLESTQQFRVGSVSRSVGSVADITYLGVYVYHQV